MLYCSRLLMEINIRRKYHLRQNYLLKKFLSILIFCSCEPDGHLTSNFSYVIEYSCSISFRKSINVFLKHNPIFCTHSWFHKILIDNVGPKIIFPVLFHSLNTIKIDIIPHIYPVLIENLNNSYVVFERIWHYAFYEF